jgi:Tfp pilus assembly protein FimV
MLADIELVALRLPAQRPSHATYVRRRVAAALLVCTLAVSAAFAAGQFAMSRSSDPAPAAAARPATASYLVQPGDTMWSIAGTHRGTTPRGEYVDALLAANGGVSQLVVGQRLVLP